MNNKKHKRIYFPDGSYKEISEEFEQIPDLTPPELKGLPKKIHEIQMKYANQKLKDVFPKMKKEIEDVFEKAGFGVEVKPILFPITLEEQYIFYESIKRGYHPIAVEITHRIGWKEGDHEKELYEWKHRKERKRAITNKEVYKWI